MGYFLPRSGLLLASFSTNTDVMGTKFPKDVTFSVVIFTQRVYLSSVQSFHYFPENIEIIVTGEKPDIGKTSDRRQWFLAF